MPEQTETSTESPFAAIIAEEKRKIESKKTVEKAQRESDAAQQRIGEELLRQEVSARLVEANQSLLQLLNDQAVMTELIVEHNTDRWRKLDNSPSCVLILAEIQGSYPTVFALGIVVRRGTSNPYIIVPLWKVVDIHTSSFHATYVTMPSEQWHELNDKFHEVLVLAANPPDLLRMIVRALYG